MFYDRLINMEDKCYFNTMLADMATKYFSTNVSAEDFENKPIIFGDFMKIGASEDDKMYEVSETNFGHMPDNEMA